MTWAQYSNDIDRQDENAIDPVLIWNDELLVCRRKCVALLESLKGDVSGKTPWCGVPHATCHLPRLIRWQKVSIGDYQSVYRFFYKHIIKVLCAWIASWQNGWHGMRGVSLVIPKPSPHYSPQISNYLYTRLFSPLWKSRLWEKDFSQKNPALCF